MISVIASKKLKVGDQKPTCAVLIAVHDGQKFLEQQLKTIISQVGVDTQIFFSDDASTDNTIQLVEKYGGTNLNIDKKKFGSAALNFFGLIKNFDLNQNFDYIFLCDQDDIWFPNKMLRAINCMKQNNTVAYSSSYYFPPSLHNILIGDLLLSYLIFFNISIYAFLCSALESYI